MRTRTFGAVAVISLLLTGCSSEAAKQEPTPSATSSPTATPSPTPEPTTEPGDSESNPVPAGSVATVNGFAGDWEVVTRAPDLAAAQALANQGAVDVGGGEVVLVVPVEATFKGTSNTKIEKDLTFTYMPAVPSSDGVIEADPAASSLLDGSGFSSSRPLEGNLVFVVPETDKPGTLRIKGALNDVVYIEGPAALSGTEQATGPTLCVNLG